MKSSRTLITVVVMLALSQLCGTAAEQGLVARYAFDEGQGLVAHDSSGYGNDGQISGGVTWVKRGDGFALRFDGSTGSIDCGKADSLMMKGDMTIEAWIKTSDTSLRDDMVIFGDGAPGGLYVNYYLFKSRGALRLDHADGTKHENLYYSGNHPVFTGEWQHIAFVAEYPRFYYYIDGVLAYTGDMKLDITPTSGGNRIIGGWTAGHFEGDLDDIRLYKRALTGMEVALHAGIESPEPWVEIATKILWLNKTMDVDVRADRLPAGSATLRVSLASPDGSAPQVQEIALNETKADSRRAFASAGFTTPGFRNGEYVVTATVLGTGGEPVTQGQSKWQCPGDPSWLGSKAGVTDKVLPPWTPVKVKQRGNAVEVGVWGRTYRFERSLFPTRITTHGKQILASPVRLIATVAGHDLEFTDCRIDVKENSRSRVVLECTSGAGGIRAIAKHTIEYDGLITSDWSVDSTTQAQLDSLSFEMRLLPEHARYLHYSSLLEGSHPGIRRGEIRDAVQTRAFTPYMWFGDEERGVQWICESARNWLNSDPGKAVQVLKDPDGITLKMSLVDHPMTLDRHGLEYTFGLQASPVRPMGKDAWDYRIVNQQLIHYGKDFELLTEKIDGQPILDYYKDLGVRAIMLNNWTKILCYTSPLGYEQELRELVRECHKRNIQVVPYFGSQISEWAPEWTDFGPETMVLPDYSNPDFYPGDPPQIVHVVCLNSEWQDFLADTIARLMDEYDVDGIYMDGTAIPMPCTNRAHGCGYIDADGKLQPTNKVFAVRNAIKRLYEIVKSRKPDGILDVHASGTMNLPAYTWTTTYWTGEDLPRVSEGKYTDIMPLDRFRTDFMGYQWGIGAEFLHYRFGDYTKSLGISLLHDVPVRAGGINRQEFELISSVWKLRDEFGVKKAKWLPYWNNAAYASVAPTGTYISMYKHPENGVLAYISNVAGQEQKAEIRLDLKKLGLSGKSLTVKDALTGERLYQNAGALSFTLPSMGWKIVWIR